MKRKVNYTAEEKKAYFAEKKKEVDAALIEGVKHCYTEGNFKKYLDTIRKFHSYSINNCMLITMQMPDATLIAGYNDWKKKFKRHVNAGEKGIKIIAPMPCKYNVKTGEKDDHGNDIEKTVEYMRYTVKCVFDYSQTEGEELPTICNPLTASVENYDQIIEALMNISSVPVTFEHFADSAFGYYDKQTNRIVVKDHLPQAQTIKTLIHEIAHSILHNDAFIGIPKSVKEIQAESVAYMVCSDLGIDTSDYSFEYVAAWAEFDMKKLTDQMAIVKKTAESITESIRKDVFS